MTGLELRITVPPTICATTTSLIMLVEWLRKETLNQDVVSLNLTYN